MLLLLTRFLTCGLAIVSHVVNYITVGLA